MPTTSEDSTLASPGSAPAAPAAGLPAATAPGTPSGDGQAAPGLSPDLIESQARIRRDRDLITFLKSPDARDEEKAFKYLDDYSRERWGIDNERGNAWSPTRQPFSSARQYADALVGVLSRGYSAIATPEYKAWMDAKASGDRDAQIKAAGISTTKLDNLGGSLMVLPSAVQKTDDEIDEELADYNAKIQGQNFVGLMHTVGADFTPQEKDIVSASLKFGDGLPQEKEAEFAYVCRHDPEKAARLLYLINRSRRQEYAWWRDNVGDAFLRTWNKTYGGLRTFMESDMSQGFLANEFAAQMRSSDSARYYWNDDEKSLFRSIADSNPRAKEYVDRRAAERMAREALPKAEQNRQRLERLMIEDAMEHKPYDDYGFASRAVAGAISTLPYMTLTAIPYAGFAANVASYFEQTRDDILLAGGNPDEAVGAQLALACAWAGLEKLEFEGLMGKPLTGLQRKAMLARIWQRTGPERLKAIGRFALATEKEALAKTLYESFQEGLQGALEGGEKEWFKSHDANKAARAAMEQGVNDFVESVGSMGILGHLGAIRAAATANRDATDYTSLADYASRRLQVTNALRGSSIQEAASEAASEEGKAAAHGASPLAATSRLLNDITDIWQNTPSAVAALDEIQEKYGFDDAQTRQIGDYLDLRQNLLDAASRLDSDDAANFVASVAGNAFRIGNDTTYDPVDLFALINPEIKVEETTANDDAKTRVRRVTVPVGSTGQTRSFTITENHEGPNVHSRAFAVSVEQAMKGSERPISADEYMAMSEDERETFLNEWGLKSGGDFRILDDATGKEVFGADGLVEMMRAYSSPHARIGGNWTLAHEYGHAISAFAQATGAIKTDDSTVAVMRKLFGDPTAPGELWNEEAANDALANYLRDKYDFRRLTPEERKAVKGVFKGLWQTVKGFFSLGGNDAPVAPVERNERARAMDAAFEALRSGDFSGLDQFAGIDFKEDAPATPESPTAQAKPSPQPTTPSAAAAPTAAPAADSAQGAPAPDAAALRAQLAALQEQLAADGEAAADNLPRRTGTKLTISTPNYAMHVEAEMTWVPLADLIESTDDREVQMRDRSRRATDNQVHNLTRPGVFYPLALFPSSKSDDGAPIIGGGNRIISGHGRKRMLDTLANEGRFSEYLSAVNAEARRRGIPTAPEGMVNPVLVSRITGGLDKREDLTRFAELSNRWGGLERSGAEYAESDARKITDALLRLYNPDASGNLLAASNRPFMAAFLKEVGATGLTNADGTPTAEAALRVQRAMMTALFGNDDKVRSMVRDLMERNQELSLASLQNALMRSAGKLLAMKRQRGSFDIVPQVREAAYHFIAWKAQQQRQNIPFRDYFAEQANDMFSAAASPIEEALALLLDAGRFASTLDKYSELVAQQAVDAQNNLSFAPPRTPLQLIGFAERAVIAPDEAPVTPDPESPEAAQPIPSPLPPPAPQPPSTTPHAPHGAAELAPQPTWRPSPRSTGTATLPGPGASGIQGFQVDADGNPATPKKSLPAGAYNLLRAPYDPKHPPDHSAQDRAGRGLGIANPATTTHNAIFPHFQGNKTEMADRTTQAIRNTMTDAEREHYTHLVDYFGGGGCWGLYHALESFPSVTTLVVNEFDPDRLGKIRLLHEIDGRVADEAAALIDRIGDRLRKACVVRDPATGEERESQAPVTIANKVNELFKREFTDPRERAILQAFIDCAQTMLGSSPDREGRVGTEKALAALREDGRKAKDAADEFKRRKDARIIYRAGDASSFHDAPKGDKTVAVADPPYYLTAGYNGQTTVPLDAHGQGWDYHATRNLLRSLVDSGDAIVYTDEAWWHKEDYAPDLQGDMFSGGESTFDDEQRTLLDIINSLDHFDVAGRVAGRQEVLGIHHGHATQETDNATDTQPEAGTDIRPADPDAASDGGGTPRAGQQPLRRLASEPQGQDRADGPLSPERRRSGGEQALATELAVRQIADALSDAGAPQDAADAVARHSVRQVRQSRIADYAALVSKNAKRWLKDAEKRLDKRMKERGFTEKVWHGTYGDDFNVFRFSDRSHGVPAAYFTYRRGTAQNYAALTGEDYVDDEADENNLYNTRQFYINPGKVLEWDEEKNPTNHGQFIEKLKQAYEEGYNSVIVRNALDDQGARLDEFDNGPMTFIEEGELPGNADDHEFMTDILIVMQQPGDNAPARIKAADPVTFLDEVQDGLPIPPAFRADQSIDDVRFSVYALGRYAGRLRQLAHGVKQGDDAAILEAARRLVGITPRNAVLVPVPGHLGRATTMLRLAQTIRAIRPDTTVVDALEAEPHESNYDQKKRLHKPPKAVTMHLRDGADIPQNRPVYLVDNVVASGVTYQAAQEILPGADILTLADTGKMITRRFPSRSDLAAILAQKRAAHESAKAQYQASHSADDFAAYSRAYAEMSDAVFALYDDSRIDGEPPTEERISADLALVRHSVSRKYADRQAHSLQSLEALAGKGDLDALAEVFQREWSHFALLARRFGRDHITPEEQNEIVAEAQLQAIVAASDPKKRKSIANFGAFVNGVIKFTALNTANRTSGGVGTRETINLDEPLDGDEGENGTTRLDMVAASPQGFDEAQEAAVRRVQEFLSHYSGAKRGIFEATQLDGLNYEEAAKKFGVPQRNVQIVVRDMIEDWKSGAYKSHSADDAAANAVSSLPPVMQRVADYFAANPAATAKQAAIDLGYTGANGQRRINKTLEAMRKNHGYVRPFARPQRHSVQRTRSTRLSDLAVAFVAARRLAGKNASADETAQLLKSLGLASLPAADVMQRADTLATRNRDAVRSMVEKNAPELVAHLARANMGQDLAAALDSAISGGAQAADPALGQQLAEQIQSKQVRDLMNAKGFTAAEMMAELPVSLADAVFAVAEYEKSPEEKARLEAERKRREEKKAQEADNPPDLDAPLREPTGEERAALDSLLDRARFANEARLDEERRRDAEKAKRDAENPDTPATGDADAEGSVPGAEAPGLSLPQETVRRIAPVFESADVFAQFIVEWTSDHIVAKHPELPSTAQMWRSPVAIRELKQTATHILRRLAKDTLGSPSLNYARNFVDHAINELESDAQLKTYNSVRRKIALIYDQIHDNALRISRRKLVTNLIAQIRKETGAKGRFSAILEEMKRTTDAKTELWARRLIPLLTMPEEKLQAEIDRLTAIVTRDPSDEASASAAPSADKLDEAADTLALAHKYGGMSRWMPGRIADAADEILQQLRGKRQAFEQRREQRKNEDKAMRDALIAAAEAGASDAYRKTGKAASRFDRYTGAMMGNLTLEMQNLIRFCKDPAKRKAALDAIETMSAWISEATGRYRTTLAQAQSEIRQGLEACYGSAEAGIKHLLSEEITEEAALDIFTQDRNAVPTFGRLLQLYATTIQQDYKDNAEKHGRDKQLDAMRRTLTDQDRAFHAWAVEWYKRNRAALSQSVENVTGLPVTSPDNLYTPARMLNEPSGFSVEAVAWSPVPSALNRRVRHGLDFNESSNFLALMQEQAEIRAQTVGYSELGIRLRDILAHHDVQAAIRKNVGKQDLKTVLDHVKDVLVQNAARKDESAFFASLNTARRWMARFALSGNIPSAVKQLASMPVWANAMLGGKEVGLKRTLHYLTHIDMDAVKELMDSDGYKARYLMGWSEETQNVLQNPSKNAVAHAIERIYDKGMIVNKFVDGLSCLWMAQGFYRDAKDLFADQGMSPDDAKRKALALTWSICESGQQSGRIENMNALQRRGGAPIAAIFQFKTAYLLQNNYLFQAIREMRAGTPGAGGRFLRALFINTVWIPAFVACVNAAWSALMGDEPPDDESKIPQWFKDGVWSMVDGVTAPMFGISTAAHTLYNALTGNTSYTQDGGIPALESSYRVIRHGATAVFDLGKGVMQEFTALDFEEEITAEKLGKDVNRLLKDLAAPYRHASKAVTNRTKED